MSIQFLCIYETENQYFPELRLRTNLVLKFAIGAVLCTTYRRAGSPGVKIGALGAIWLEIVHGYYLVIVIAILL